MIEVGRIGLCGPVSLIGLGGRIRRIVLVGLDGGMLVFLPPPKTLIASAILDFIAVVPFLGLPLVGDRGRERGTGGFVGLRGLSNGFIGEAGRIGEAGLGNEVEVFVDGGGNCGYEST